MKVVLQSITGAEAVVECGDREPDDVACGVAWRSGIPVRVKEESDDSQKL